jgi:hypothetical protein
MNCKEIKYFLLGCENPDRPPAEVKAHLAVCAGCQDWQNRLAVIEMNIPFLPVPDSAARTQLLRTIQTRPMPSVGTAAVSDTASGVGATLSRPQEVEARPLPIRSSTTKRASVLQFFRAWEPSARRYAAGAVAATIMLAVFGWMVFHTPHHPPIAEVRTPHSSADPLLASIVRQDLRLAKSDEPAERFLVLADLAEDLSGEVKRLAPVPEAKGVLDELVDRYEEVVRTGLTEAAQKLPDKTRNDLLNKVAERLQVAGRKAEELGDQLAPKIPISSREALRRLTTAAQNGDNRLRDLRVQNLHQEPANIQLGHRSALVRRNSP